MSFARCGVEVVFSGPFCADELVEVKTKVWMRHAEGKITHQVVNLLGVEDFGFQPEQAAQFRKMDEVVSLGGPPCRIALVVNDAAIMSSSEAYANQDGHGALEVQVFVDVNKARRWAQQVSSSSIFPQPVLG